MLAAEGVLEDAADEFVALDGLALPFSELNNAAELLFCVALTMIFPFHY